MITGIEISEALQYSEDGLFVLLGGLERVVGCEGVHEGPGVQSEFLAIEGALFGLGPEMGSKIGEGIVFADNVLAVFFSHSYDY